MDGRPIDFIQASAWVMTSLTMQRLYTTPHSPISVMMPVLRSFPNSQKLGVRPLDTCSGWALPYGKPVVVDNETRTSRFACVEPQARTNPIPFDTNAVQAGPKAASLGASVSDAGHAITTPN